MKKYSKKLKEIEIEIDEQAYILREFTGVTRDKYLNDVRGRMIDTDPVKLAAGNVQIRNLDGLQASFVALCLFEKGADEPVPYATINSWPATLVAELFDDAQKLNGMGPKAEVEAKNA